MEAFVYKWVNQENGKTYVGYHVGDPEDRYITSSQNQQFWDDYHAKKLTRVIVAVGSKEAMQERERDEFNAVVAQGVEVYNKATPQDAGGYANAPLDQLMQDYAEFKRSGYQPVGKLKVIQDDVEDVHSLVEHAFQVRANNLNTGKVDLIAATLDVNKIEPIFIVRGYKAEDGQIRDVVLNGNHTIRACKQAKLGMVPTVRVRFGEQGLTSATSMMILGNFLNAGDPKCISTVADMRNVIAQSFADGEKVTSKGFKDQLMRAFPHLAPLVADTVSKFMKSITDVVPPPGTGPGGAISPGASNLIQYLKDKEGKKLMADVCACYEDEFTAVIPADVKAMNNSIGQMLAEMAKTGKRKGVMVTYVSSLEHLRTDANLDMDREKIAFHGLAIEIKKPLPHLKKIDHTWDNVRGMIRATGLVV